MIVSKRVDIPSKVHQNHLTQAMRLECETILCLHHPHIVNYFDIAFEESPSVLHIIQEYIPGGSIGSCLRQHGALKEDLSKSFTAQILEGLEHLHSVNIIHRGLKADNVLVETNGVCKISDIGISRYLDDFTDGIAAATVFWMAPEVVAKRDYDSKCDIWSAGCVAVEMWTGQRPWGDEDSNAVLINLCNMKTSPHIPEDIALSHLANSFKDLCFKVDPSCRPSAAQLRGHPYLALPQDWVFVDFKQEDSIAS
ncbi:hypothetical protein SERLA73DRAFT_60475 [Serpula lacrymans var. lacrymans S7.3]|uniref:Protein kinase domain-containing protein n=2 Tax=Serpula lacrymans var. lacrymans TaxID=341189 RepID=F8Q865_SERL3|nr:hypothetical protein SERLA73DRAFT_60475 [Serpula lacrymans var. lacrymans S7.3]